MFAPVGYISIHKFIFDTLNITWPEVFKREIDERKELCHGDLSRVMRSIVLWSPVDDYERRIINSIKSELFIASPSGVVLDFYPPSEASAGFVFESISPLLYCSDVFNLADDEPFPEGIVCHTYADFNAMRQRFIEIIQNAAPLKLREFRSFIRSLPTGFTNIPTWYNRNGYFISSEGARWARKAMPESLSLALPPIDALSPFDGWALCVRKDFEFDQSQRLSVEKGSLFNEADANNRGNGRPAHLREAVANLYLSNPDMFKNRNSWNSLMRALDKQHGLKVSKETIKRAMEAPDAAKLSIESKK